MKLSAAKFLFACFFLLTSSGTRTHAHENEPGVIRVVVEEGRDAILPCLLSTKEDIAQSLFDWKKDDQKEVFLYEGGDQYNNGREGQDEQFKDRVFHFLEELRNGNASIVIKNTRISDSGIYTCAFPNLPPNGQKFQIELAVGAARKPYITTDVTEDGLLLQCEVQDAYPKPEVEWQDSAGNNLTAEELQVTDRGDRYDVTLLATVTKTDRFRCVVKQKEIHHVIFAETFVFFPGATPEPHIKTLDQTKDWSLLQCVVRGASPKPKVEWQDSSGNILPAEEPQVTERGGSYDIILNITVTKTDRYQCVVKQKEIDHMIADDTSVYIHEKEYEVWAACFFGGLFLGPAIFAAVRALLVARKHITKSRNKGSPPQRNGSCNGTSLLQHKAEPHQNENGENNGVV